MRLPRQTLTYFDRQVSSNADSVDDYSFVPLMRYNEQIAVVGEAKLMDVALFVFKFHLVMYTDIFLAQVIDHDLLII